MVEPPSVGSGRPPQRGSRITSTVEQFAYSGAVLIHKVFISSNLQVVSGGGGGSGIQDVAVTALRLASRVTTGDRLTLVDDGGIEAESSRRTR